MRKVAFCVPTGEIGGAENSLLLLLEGLDKELFDPLVICGTEGPLIEKLKQLNIRYKVVNFPKAFMRLSRSSILTPLGLISGLISISKVSRLLIHGKVDILYTNGIKCHVMGCIAAKLSGIKLIWHFRDILQKGKFRTIMQLLARVFPDRIITASKATAEQFSWPTGTLFKVKVVYNGVNLKEFYPGPPPETLCKEFNLINFDNVVGIFGMLVPLKGHKYFIEAVEKVLRTFPKSLFLIVGDEIYLTANKSHVSYGASLKVLVRKKRLNHSVKFTGYRNDVSQIMRCCDVIVLPSIHPESCPRTVLEAMACGKPVVGTMLGGTKELIENNLSGKLVKPGDAQSLAEGILSFLQDDRIRERDGLYARKQTEIYYSAEKHCEEIQKVLLPLTNQAIRVTR